MKERRSREPQGAEEKKEERRPRPYVHTAVGTRKAYEEKKTST